MPSEQYENVVAMFKGQREAGLISTPEPPEWRKGYDMVGSLLPPVPEVTQTEIDIAGIPTVKMETSNAAEDRAILFLHGGGYVIGSRGSHGPLVANITRATNTTAYLLEYRLAPEHRWPAAIEDAEAAYAWLLDRYPPEGITLIGDSAGGGLALTLLVHERDAGRPLPASVVLLSPWIDMTQLGPVSDEALATDYLRPEALEAFAGHYQPDEERRADPSCSPITADLRGLPRMLIEVGDAEILADQGRRLAAKVKNAGNDVTLTDEPHMFHDWAIFAGAFPEADEAIARIASFVSARLS